MILITSSNPPTWKQLIVPTLSEGNRASLMASIFDCDELEPFEYLSGNDAQAFVDVIDEASIRLLPLLKGINRIPLKLLILAIRLCRSHNLHH